MDWKIFPPTQTSIFNQQLSQRTRVSLDKLVHNLDALLKRDRADCLTKQLNGLLESNARIYQVRPRFGRLRQTPGTYVLARKTGNTVKCNTVEEGYYRQPALGAGNKKTLTLQSKTNRSQCHKSRSTAHRELLFKEEPETPPQLCPKFSSGKGKNKMTLQSNSEDLRCEGGLLPSNGWWQNQGSSDSETETEAGIEETDRSASLSSEIKSDEFPQPCLASDGRESGQLSLCGSEFSEENCHNCATVPVRASSCPKQNGIKKPCNFFHLTSRETCLVLSPSQTTPIPGDKTCQTPSEDKSLLCSSESLSLGSDAVKFDDDLKLAYGELLQHRPYTTSRINYNKLVTTGYNYPVPNRGRIQENGNDAVKSLENRDKLRCVLPKMNFGKVNKITPLGFTEKAVNVIRRSNTAYVPVKLRLKHRSKCSVKFKGEVKEDSGADERVLPTTLTKSADVSYSIMSSYMANVVWSVMDDEKVL